MDIHEVVMKLVGPIDPIGDESADEKRFENLEALTYLTDMLLGDIRFVARHKGDHRHSMHKAGKHSANFLNEVKSTD